ncbi:hypothetical protein TNCV_2485461 [Trichonephila clavipes]|uniref:Uncharacterized protein n=1 Tax=Trichonephila clavipes TaxID=2585209 RepID=A0A8X7BAV9_TRICX|nr:hypothetical protein TNCV_2485461 [Trichonephila clavipes]
MMVPAQNRRDALLSITGESPTSFPEENTTMLYPGFEHEPTRLQAEEPIVEEEIPALYENDKVELHLDKAFIRTSQSNATYLAIKNMNTIIPIIPLDEIPVKLPDASPMWTFVISVC